MPQWQVASGHNISLHLVARAYHLRAIAFFDEVLATATSPSTESAGPVRPRPRTDLDTR